MKIITINVPDDCEVKIIRKEEKKESAIRTYQDLIDNKIDVKGYYINNISSINDADNFANDVNKNVASSEKVAKSMLAMAQISQLMPYYGGAITNEEWNKSSIIKYVIDRDHDKIIKDSYYTNWVFLAFRTIEYRDEFLKYNEQLVKDYLMID